MNGGVQESVATSQAAEASGRSTGDKYCNVPPDERRTAGAWGPAWNEAGLVFTREDGSPLRPEYATRHFRLSPEPPAFQ